MESSISNDAEYEMIENLADNLRTYCNNNNDLSIVALRTFIKDNIPTKHLQDVLREASMLCDSKNIFLWMLLIVYLSIIQRVLVLKMAKNIHYILLV